MSCPVNLLPESCHNARRRILRRNAWTVFVLSTGLLVVGAWAALRATERTRVQLDCQLTAIQARNAELQRQLTLATIIRNDLARRARTLATLRQEQLLPRQLLTLSRQAPPGVVFTEISAQSTGSLPPAARAGMKARRAVGLARSRPQNAAPRDQSVTGGPRDVQMSGYASDHDQLTRLIRVLQHVPQWEYVELLGAAREPYRTGMALAFQLECRPPEASR